MIFVMMMISSLNQSWQIGVEYWAFFANEHPEETSGDGTVLIVRSFCDEHNHPISRVCCSKIINQCYQVCFTQIGTIQAAATLTQA